MRRDFLGLRDDLFRGAYHCRPTNRERTRTVGAHPEWNLRGITVDNIDLTFVDTNHICNNLRKSGFMPLPVAVRPDHNRDGTRRVHTHSCGIIKTCTRTQLTNEVRRRDATSLNVVVDAQSTPFAFGLGLFAACFKAREISDFFQLIHRRVIITCVIFYSHRRGIWEFSHIVLTT